MPEADWLPFVDVGNGDRDTHCPLSGPNHHRRLARRMSTQQTTATDFREVGRFHLHFAEVRQISLAAVTVSSGHKNLSHGARPDQADRFRLNHKRNRMANVGGLVCVSLRQVSSQSRGR